MKAIQPHYITDAQGKRISVVLSLRQWQHVLEKLEELEDIRQYDQVKARQEPTMPLDEYLKKTQAHGPLPGDGPWLRLDGIWYTKDEAGEWVRMPTQSAPKGVKRSKKVSPGS